MEVETDPDRSGREVENSVFVNIKSVTLGGVEGRNSICVRDCSGNPAIASCEAIFSKDCHATARNDGLQRKARPAGEHQKQYCYF